MFAYAGDRTPEQSERDRRMEVWAGRKKGVGVWAGAEISERR